MTYVVNRHTIVVLSPCGFDGWELVLVGCTKLQAGQRQKSSQIRYKPKTHQEISQSKHFTSKTLVCKKYVDTLLRRGK